MLFLFRHNFSTFNLIISGVTTLVSGDKYCAVELSSPTKSEYFDRFLFLRFLIITQDHGTRCH